MSIFELVKTEIKDFKAIEYLVIESNGNHVRLTGSNGTCKSATIDALIVSLSGKTALPVDAIRYGAEESSIETTLKDEGGIEYVIRTRIRPGDDFKLDIKMITAAGAKVPVKAPIDFLEKIVGPLAFNPQRFAEKSDEDQLADIYAMCPGLKSALDKLDKEYAAEQQVRSNALAEIRILEADLKRTPFDPDPSLPAEQIELTEIINKINDAGRHNATKTEKEKTVEQIASVYREKQKNIESMRADIVRKQEMITGILKDIDALNTSIKTSTSELATLESEIDNLNIEISDFKPTDVKTLQDSLVETKKTNEKVRNNKEHRRIQKQLDEKKEAASDLLRKMKEIDDRRPETMNGAKLPVPGLTIKDGAIWFPSPKSSEPRRLSSLSEGEKWPVLTRLHAAFNPQLRIMVVRDFTGLDPKNRAALFQAAKEHGLQLWIHETSQDSSDLHVTILDAEGKPTK